MIKKINFIQGGNVIIVGAVNQSGDTATITITADETELVIDNDTIVGDGTEDDPLKLNPLLMLDITNLKNKTEGLYQYSSGYFSTTELYEEFGDEFGSISVRNNEIHMNLYDHGDTSIDMKKDYIDFVTDSLTWNDKTIATINDINTAIGGLDTILNEMIDTQS